MTHTNGSKAIISILALAQLFSIAAYANPGDACDDPIPIFLGQEYQGSTEGATGTDVSSCGNDDAYDVWHSFTPEFSDEYTVSLCGSSFDTTLAVFDACAGNEIACNDDWGDCGAQSQLTVYLEAGETYLIRVAGHRRETGDYVLLVMGLNNRVIDGFETGSFSALPWQDQETPWHITLDTFYTGLFSARSGFISDNERSILTLTHNCKAGDIRFAVKVSSEQDYDELIFSIDGQDIYAWSGEMDWIWVDYPVTAGPHTFTWSYEKDGLRSMNEDAAWIDDVVFTGSEVPEGPNTPKLPDSPADINFVYIPGGTFEMGDHFNVGWYDERPVHPVTLDSFILSKYETTNAQYAEYLNAALADGWIQVVDGAVFAAGSDQSKPYFDTHSASMDSQIEYGQGQFTVRSRDGHSMADHPVVKVSWYGAKAFCDYYGYRLPTEAEWEYAARGGYHNPYYKYPWGSNTLDENEANYDFHNPLGLTSWPYTTPVGLYGPQGTYSHGLCDMAGNVREWCQDRYGSYGTSASPASNPVVGPSRGDYRVLRGGSWFHNANYCRTADRNRYGPLHRSRYSGFRVCVSAWELTSIE